MGRTNGWRALGAMVPIAAPLYAVEYLSVEEAQRALFPEADRFAPLTVAFTPEERRAIAQAARALPAPGDPRGWAASRDGRPLGHVWIDRVIGKHEHITFAVAVDPAGRVAGVEILDYRESYGGEVRRPAWRAQFRGKTAADPLTVGRDVRNISGATLSCRNVAAGVRRVLAAHAAVVRG